MRSESAADLQALIELLPNPVIFKNRAHRIVLVNDRACELLKHSREDLLTRRDEELFPLNEVRVFHQADTRVFETGEVDESEEQLTDGDGHVRSLITRKQRVTLDAGEYLVAVVTDVTAFRKAEAKSRYLAFYDALTGLPNRSQFGQRIEQAVLENAGDFALLYIDLDDFKAVNDRYGHPAGDELLQIFAQRLAGVVRPGDMVARLGGDEFAILLTPICEASAINDVCQRIVAAASQVFALSDGHVQVSASVGVAMSGPGQIDHVEMLRRADLALYYAKGDGRGCWREFTSELDHRLQYRQLIEADLREALQTGSGLEVFYQPIVTIASGKLTGYEALARWRHPTRGLVMPDEFIPIAEASGVIVALGEWVLRRACTDAAQWPPDLRLFVNVSPIQFAHTDLAVVVNDLLEKSGFNPDRLELELTESVLLNDTQGALAILTAIRALGVKLVLDDFGTGYSGLLYLRRFPFDKVKIDRMFIKDIAWNKDARSIVGAVITLIKSLNMQVVAEGVETAAQLALLRDFGCTQAQGYFIGRPMSIQGVSEPVHNDPAQTATN